jgi:hypothetical protein
MLFLEAAHKREVRMGESGKKDKSKKEQRKKPKLTIKEKRKLKKQKHSNTVIPQ